MAAKNVYVDKNSKVYQESLVAGGRSNLVLVMILTVVNLVMLALDTGSHFLFSASVPYYLVWFGKCFDNGTLNGSGSIGPDATVGLVIAGVILVIYLLCWLLSKKRSGWLTAAAVLFSIDTAVLLYIALVMMENPAGFIMDIVLHAYVLFLLIRGCIAAKKVKQMAEEGFEDSFSTSPDLDY